MSYSFHQLKRLEGKNLVLTPLTQSEMNEVAAVLVSPTTWFSKTRDINSKDAFTAYFTPMLERQNAGENLTLIARLKSDNRVVASSTFQYPSRGFRKVEIGFTWVADEWQRTFVNTEMKLLMLTHAFEEMKTNRVEFSIHPRNKKSNAAIKRIGAEFEGLLRKWRFLPGSDDGHRNLYSIIDDEWPAVKARLHEMLEFQK
jgi:N-acetyltransferase